jgi:hypothetical protein
MRERESEKERKTERQREKVMMNILSKTDVRTNKLC